VFEGDFVNYLLKRKVWLGRDFLGFRFVEKRANPLVLCLDVVKPINKVLCVLEKEL